MIYDNFRVIGAHDTVVDCSDLFSVTLRDDDVREFETRWDGLYCLSWRSHVMTSGKVCTHWGYVSPRNSRTGLELNDMDMQQKISMPCYQKLKTMVKRSVDQKIRLRNFDARHGRIESGAVIRSRKGSIGVEGGKVSVTRGKKKASVRKETSVVSGTEIQDRAQKPEHTAATPSEPTVSRGRSVSRKREVSEAKVTMGPFFDPCRYYLRGICTRTSCGYIGIRPSANSTKMKRVVRLETSVCFRITRLMNNQIRSPKRATFPEKKRKRWQECSGCC